MMDKNTPMVVLNANLGGVGPSIDINAPKFVEIETGNDRQVLWVNVDGVCRLRISNLGDADLQFPSRLSDEVPTIRVVAGEDGNDYDANGVNTRADMLQLIHSFLHGARQQCAASGDQPMADLMEAMEDVLMASGFVMPEESTN